MFYDDDLKEGKMSLRFVSQKWMIKYLYERKILWVFTWWRFSFGWRGRLSELLSKPYCKNFGSSKTKSLGHGPKWSQWVFMTHSSFIFLFWCGITTTPITTNEEKGGNQRPAAKIIMIFAVGAFFQIISYRKIFMFNLILQKQQMSEKSSDLKEGKCPPSN